jgi:prepilin-type N-terminal cleavage/methylation domain-containing protein
MLKRRAGFTLIEIVLVLAIAGLILVIIFLAVAGAQSNRRDAQRKRDLARIAAQLDSYASTHGGQYPAVNSSAAGFTGGFASTYMASGFDDPLAGQPYDLKLNFGPPCSPGSPMTSNGPGSVRYDVPGTNFPYHIRMCLEQGQSDIGG